MTCLNLIHVMAVMGCVTFVCTFLLWHILLSSNRFKKFSCMSNVTGKEVFKLNTFGSVAFVLIQLMIFGAVLASGYGAEHFA